MRRETVVDDVASIRVRLLLLSSNISHSSWSLNLAESRASPLKVSSIYSQSECLLTSWDCRSRIASIALTSPRSGHVSPRRHRHDSGDRWRHASSIRCLCCRSCECSRPFPVWIDRGCRCSTSAPEGTGQARTPSRGLRTAHRGSRHSLRQLE